MSSSMLLLLRQVAPAGRTWPVYSSMLLLGCSDAALAVSTYARSQREAMSLGFRDDLDMYLVLSGGQKML